MLFLPRYTHSDSSPSVVFCSLSIFLESVLLGSTFSISMPAIIAWLIAGKHHFDFQFITQTYAFILTLLLKAKTLWLSLLKQLNLNLNLNHLINFFD